MEDTVMKDNGGNPSANINVEVKYFKLDETYICAQLSTQMTGQAFKNLTGDQGSSRPLKQGRAMVLCLDKSGSMSGTPFKALQEGAKLVGKSLYENDEFEHFATVFYDNRATKVEAKTLDEYDKKID